MTRVGIIPVSSCKHGLWTPSGSEGRIPLDWAALLAANGYSVVGGPSPTENPIECSLPVAWAQSDHQLDYVIYCTTFSHVAKFSNPFFSARRPVRIQWPNGVGGVRRRFCSCGSLCLR